jgi:hypothetical protein
MDSEITRVNLLTRTRRASSLAHTLEGGCAEAKDFLSQHDISAVH